MSAVQRKRVSKKNKKSWRKHVDITDVENFLEEKRLEERLGGDFSDKKDDELFTLDTEGTFVPDAKPVYNLIKRSKSLRVKEIETPKCFSLLERRSAVPDPLIKRNHVRVREKVPKIRPKQTPKAKENGQSMFRDIWNETDETRNLEGHSDWLSPDTVRHILHNTGRKDSLRSSSLKVKPSPLAAVEIPHPGMSYNPSLKDHLQLLEVVAKTELAIEKDEAHVHRVTTGMFRKIPRDEAERDYINEMSFGLNPSSESEADRGDYSTINPPVQRKKKTLKTRRKIREERERKQDALMKKIEKKKRSDVNNRMKNLQTTIKKREEKSDAFQKRKAERQKQKVFETKTLSKIKFTPQPLEFLMPTELTGTLRNLPPQGSVLMERFTSIQKRNLLEPCQQRIAKKAKIKRFVKGSHKMGWEPKGY